MRDKRLKITQFLSAKDARAKIEAWRVDYNAHRPHSSLGNLRPSEFARMLHGNRTSEVASLYLHAVQQWGTEPSFQESNLRKPTSTSGEFMVEPGSEQSAGTVAALPPCRRRLVAANRGD